MGTLPLWGALLGLVLVAVVLCPGHQAIDAIVLQGALTICEIPCGCARMSLEAGRCRYWRYNLGLALLATTM